MSEKLSWHEILERLTTIEKTLNETEEAKISE